MCNSKSDAETIIKVLQSHIRKFNLNLNENKSAIKELPEGLFRNWTANYQKITLRYKKKIDYKRFENTFLSVLEIDRNNNDTGVIDKFLSELTSKNYKIKLNIKTKDVLKTFSLLLLLKERRVKSFPQILAIIELLFEQLKKDIVSIKRMTTSIEKIFLNKMGNVRDNQYDLLWFSYFVKSNRLFSINWNRKINCELLQSIKSNNQRFFVNPDFKLYSKIKKPGKNIPLIKHLAIFT